MRLEQMGSYFPTRLSFLRVLLRELAPAAGAARWHRWTMNAEGHGEAVLTVKLKERALSLIAYTAPLDPQNRTDRVIAEAWDACFALFDGVPTDAEIDALRAPTLVQEKGRFSDKVLVLSRANKSVRLFDHLLEELAAGRQPDPERINATGYLMRTTAVYGNGKFGIADRGQRNGEPAQIRPFRFEMLCVYLIRDFTIALVEHVAGQRAGAARKLDPAIRQTLGIGNSTGLGMAPFLVNHSVLLHRWIAARETALARVTQQVDATSDSRCAFLALLDRAEHHLSAWTVPDQQEQQRINALKRDFAAARNVFRSNLDQSHPWWRVLSHAQSVSADLEEFVIPLLLEPHGALIDDLADTMADDSAPHMDPGQSLTQLRQILEKQYDWTNATGFDAPGTMTWYVSEEKLEPRFGVDGPHFETRHRLPLDIARAVRALQTDLKHWDGEQMVAAFLARHPQHRHTVLRVQRMARNPYGEIRDDLVSHRTRPIDMLRCKLSFFGADRFDPKSDRWTRVRLFAGAPCLSDLNPDTAADGFLSGALAPEPKDQELSQRVEPQVPA